MWMQKYEDCLPIDRNHCIIYYTMLVANVPSISPYPITYLHLAAWDTQFNPYYSFHGCERGEGTQLHYGYRVWSECLKQTQKCIVQTDQFINLKIYLG